MEMGKVVSGIGWTQQTAPIDYLPSLATTCIRIQGVQAQNRGCFDRRYNTGYRSTCQGVGHWCLGVLVV